MTWWNLLNLLKYCLFLYYNFRCNYKICVIVCEKLDGKPTQKPEVRWLAHQNGWYSWLILPGLTWFSNDHAIIMGTSTTLWISLPVALPVAPSLPAFFSSSVCSISSASCSFITASTSESPDLTTQKQRKRRTRVCSPKRHGFYVEQFIYNTCTCVYI